MRCDNCKNAAYCALHKEDKELIGCTSGVPGYLPEIVAKDLVKIIKTGATKLGLDEEQYFTSIIASAMDLMSSDK